ncbi:MAG: fatty acid--CoA ligase family protein [Synechococcaceae cyanobacterium]|nr:fatty acid--CoA ligase family protein [Synechococcaceae cyanobacterium]
MAAEDVVLVGKPLCHAGGLQTQLLPSLMAGARVVLAMRPSPATAVALIRRYDVTEFGLLASDLLDFVDHLEAHGLALPSLRTVIGSGDTVPLELQERFRRLFGWTVLEGCGMTEVGGYYAMQPIHGERQPGSLGLPTPGTELRLLPMSGTEEVEPGEVGEIAVRTASATIGYWKNPEATRDLFRDGWLMSGDLARRDADGTLWFCGRRKLVIVRRGSNIDPAEIEERLDAHPAVHAAVVVGVPHPRDGEVPVAWIQAQSGARLPDDQQLRGYLAEHLAAYKLPVRFLPITDLPRNSTGKFDRVRLRQRAISLLDQP